MLIKNLDLKLNSFLLCSGGTVMTVTGDRLYLSTKPTLQLTVLYDSGNASVYTQVGLLVCVCTLKYYRLMRMFTNDNLNAITQFVSYK